LTRKHQDSTAAIEVLFVIRDGRLILRSCRKAGWAATRPIAAALLRRIRCMRACLTRAKMKDTR
jgi:hypothetical protein